MVNMSIPFRRSNYALTTLVAELTALWGAPYTPPQFMTGYPSPGNITGHNPDNNGVTHAVDLFFKPGVAWNEDRGRALAEWLRTVEVPRGQVPGQPQRAWYVIYRDHLAGPMTGYQWSKRPDGSGYGHWDHVHISTTDLPYGEHTALPPADYDTRAPWGVLSGTVNTQGSPTSEEDSMAQVIDPVQAESMVQETTNRTVAALKEVLLTKGDGAWMNDMRDAQHAAVMKELGAKLNKEDGGYIVGLITALDPEDSDPEAAAEAIKALIPEGLAEAVVAALGRKLTEATNG